jgi:hypothetical protein
MPSFADAPLILLYQQGDCNRLGQTEMQSALFFVQNGDPVRLTKLFYAAVGTYR